MDNLNNEILDAIPYEHKNRVTKKHIAYKLGIPYEKVCEKIKELRKKYIILVDDEDGGYYKTNSIKELNQFIYDQQQRSYWCNKSIMIAYQEINKIKNGEK